MPKITSCLLTHKAEINTETTANVLNLAPAIFPQRGATQSCTRRNLQRLGSHWAGGQRAALALGSARCTVRPFLFTWLHGNFQRKLPAHFSHFHLGVCINSWEQESTRLYVNTIKKYASAVLYVRIDTYSRKKSVFITLLPALFWQTRPAAPPLSCVPTLGTRAARRWRTAGLACSGEKREPKRGA